MIHSFLLIGQSNMAGRGFVDEVEPISDPNLKVLRNGRWQRMYVPVNNDRAFSGVSLAESFALEYHCTHNVEVGLIPCADGGTCLDQWRVGGLLYDHAVMMAKLAQRTSTIAGVLWHQGESDCKEEYHPYYKEKFLKIMNAFRKDLGLYDVPFMLGGLGSFLVKVRPDLGNYPIINKALMEIAETNPMTGFVSAEGLTSNPDNLHFNSKSLREFGIRYYKEFEKYEDKNKVFEEKSDMDSAIRSEMELL